MTLDQYADLFDDDLDYVASALSNARRAEGIIVPATLSPARPRLRDDTGPAAGSSPTIDRGLTL